MRRENYRCSNHSIPNRAISDEVMKFAAPEFHSLHFNEREGTKYWLDQKARTAVIVTCVCCNNMLFFDRENFRMD